MTASIRWRIMTLQAVMVLVLAFGAGFAFSEANFVNGMIQDQLVAQKIFFPGPDQIKAGGALDPAEFPASIRQYAGQQVDNGDKAKEYANNFIGIHLKGVANGQSYAQVSGARIAASAQLANTPKTDPNYATLQAQVATLTAQSQTLFQGETLRGLLLNAWGWSQVGLYTAWAGIVLSLAAFVVLVAFTFEAIRAYQAYRKESEKVITGKPSPIPA